MGALEDWVHLQAVQAISQHATAVIFAVLVFGVLGRLIAHLIPEGHARKVVIVLDDIVLIVVLALFGYELISYLWNTHLISGTVPTSAAPKVTRP